MTHDELTMHRVSRGKALKQLRVGNGITITQLSRKAGLSIKTIYGLESGAKCWNVNTEIIYTETCNGYGAFKGFAGGIKKVNLPI